MICYKNDHLFSRKSISRALKTWHSAQELGRHSLSLLKIVEKQRQAAGWVDTPIGRGIALRGTLREAIEKLKPDSGRPDFADKRWRPYLILTKQFIEGRPPGYVASLLGIARSTYNHSQAAALDILANLFRELEQSHANLDHQYADRCGSFLLVPLRPSYRLVGRYNLLKEVKEQLFAGRCLAFTGLPGVGKTALAVELAHQADILNHFHDGVLWAHLGCTASVLAILGAWAAALGIDPGSTVRLTSIEERAKVIHAAISRRRMLLVIDDARDVEAALALRLGGQHCAHLLTTRLAEVAVRFASRGVVRIPELSEDASLVLLAQLAPEAVVAEPERARKLVQQVGGLPLALVLRGYHL